MSATYLAGEGPACNICDEECHLVNRGVLMNIRKLLTLQANEVFNKALFTN